MRISLAGVALVKRFEGYSGHPYDDGTGVWTIGYGHIEGVTPRSPFITEPQAARLLQRDLDRVYAPAVNALGIAFNQNEFDALVSFVYNVGVGTMGAAHDIGRLLRGHQLHAAADSMLEYDRGGGHIMEGLRRRRAAERHLFLTPVKVSPPKDSGWRIVQGCPVNARIAPYIALLTTDTAATVNSLYRGQDAAQLLHRHGHHTQAEIWATSPPGVANPPGRSTHELRSDGVAYAGPIGRHLPLWCQGIDVNDSDVAAMINRARHYGWQLAQPYRSGIEFHHLCFRAPPRAHGLAMRVRIARIRATLPRS